jgi:hypothetical protein
VWFEVISLFVVVRFVKKGFMQMIQILLMKIQWFIVLKNLLDYVFFFFLSYLLDYVNTMVEVHKTCGNNISLFP